MVVENIKISDVIPYDKNAKKHPDEKEDYIMANKGSNGYFNKEMLAILKKGEEKPSKNKKKSTTKKK